MTANLGKPKEVLGDGGGAALDFHQWELIFCCHQDVVFVVEHGSQVHASEDKQKTGEMGYSNSVLWSDYFQLHSRTV